MASQLQSSSLLSPSDQLKHAIENAEKEEEYVIVDELLQELTAELLRRQHGASSSQEKPTNNNKPKVPSFSGRRTVVASHPSESEPEKKITTGKRKIATQAENDELDSDAFGAETDTKDPPSSQSGSEEAGEEEELPCPSVNWMDHTIIKAAEMEQVKYLDELDALLEAKEDDDPLPEIVCSFCGNLINAEQHDARKCSSFMIQRCWEKARDRLHRVAVQTMEREYKKAKAENALYKKVLGGMHNDIKKMQKEAERILNNK